MRTFSTIAILILCASVGMSQTTWHVDASATAPGTGSVATPFVTLQQAFNAAAPFDVILIEPGLYIENLASPNKPLIVRGVAGAKQTIIRGNPAVQAPVFHFDGPSNDFTQLQGLTISGGLGKYFPATQMVIGGGVLCENARPNIRFCILRANTAIGAPLGPGVLGFGGAIGWFNNGPEVISSIITDNEACCAGGAVFGMGQPTGTSLFFSTAFYYNMSGEGGVFALDDSDVDIYNCTMTDNLATVRGGMMYLYNNTMSPNLINNISRLNQPDEIHCYLGNQPTLNYNIISGGWIGPGANNWDWDPCFADPANLDYRIMDFSPCRNFGMAMASMPITDFEGNPRIAEGAVDIGADEWDGNFLLKCGAGNVGQAVGGPYDMLFVNGSAGLPKRQVSIPVFHAFDLSMATPPHDLLPWDFVLCGKLGHPGVTDQTVLPMSWGTMCFPPAPMAPADPTLFVVSPGALPYAPTPWVYHAPWGLPIPIEFTLQAVAWPSSMAVSVTNGVIVQIN